MAWTPLETNGFCGVFLGTISMIHSSEQDNRQVSNAVDLAQKKCIPCEVGGPPLTVQQAEALLKNISGWTLSPGARAISKAFTFPDFKTAFDFVAIVAALTEEEGHHPNISLSWGRVGIELSTHAVQGLSENDFIVATKIDAL